MPLGHSTWPHPNLLRPGPACGGLGARLRTGPPRRRRIDHVILSPCWSRLQRGSPLPMRRRSRTTSLTPCSASTRTGGPWPRRCAGRVSGAARPAARIGISTPPAVPAVGKLVAPGDIPDRCLGQRARSDESPRPRELVSSVSHWSARRHAPVHRRCVRPLLLPRARRLPCLRASASQIACSRPAGHRIVDPPCRLRSRPDRASRVDAALTHPPARDIARRPHVRSVPSRPRPARCPYARQGEFQHSSPLSMRSEIAAFRPKRYSGKPAASRASVLS